MKGYITTEEAAKKLGYEYSVEDRGYLSPCWIWQRSSIPSGKHLRYGNLKVNGLSVLAHRFYYEHLRGPITDDLCLDHLCRNTLCVNPQHLEPVTLAVNQHRGAKSKLTMEQAEQIRKLYATTKMTQRQLAERYGVCQRTINKVVNNEGWVAS